MFWVLQDRFFDPHAFAELRRQLDAQAAPHAVVRVNARTLEVDPPVGPEGAVFVCGSSTLGRVAKARGWWPGYVDDNLDYRLLAHHYGGHLLNADAACVPLDEASPPAGPVFVRPVGDGKQFAGRRRRYPDGLKVVEINAIGSSAFYAADIGRFVAAIEAMVRYPA